MTLVLVGLNHASAPIAVREAFHVKKSEIEPLLKRLRQELGVAEAVLLATCNRVELYLRDADAERVMALLAGHARLSFEEAWPYFYVKDEQEAAAHLFRVSAGLDSVVLGEDQILGQVAEALRAAQAARSSGRILNSLFLMAVAYGKRVRSETSLGEGAFSVGRVAVDLARHELGSLQDKKVLIVGAGKISEISARHLTAQGVPRIFVANRTHNHAVELASKIGGEAVFFEDLRTHLAEVDILISCTSAPHVVIHAALVRDIMLARPGRQLLLLDLAVPRDIDPDVVGIPGVRLVNIDDLKSLKEESHRRRLDEVPKVEALLVEAEERWKLQLAGLQTSHVISALHQKLDRIRKSELGKIEHVMASLSSEQREAVELATQAIMRKFLHEPTVQLKEMHMRDQEIVPVVNDLFRLQATVTQEVH